MKKHLDKIVDDFTEQARAPIGYIFLPFALFVIINNTIDFVISFHQIAGAIFLVALSMAGLMMILIGIRVCWLLANKPPREIGSAVRLFAMAFGLTLSAQVIFALASFGLMQLGAARYEGPDTVTFGSLANFYTSWHVTEMLSSLKPWVTLDMNASLSVDNSTAGFLLVMYKIIIFAQVIPIFKRSFRMVRNLLNK